MLDIKSKAAIITGGGTGVGRATSLTLAELGCNVAVNYSRSQDDAEKTAADCRAFGVKAIAVKANVAIDAECRAMVDQTVQAFGRLDMLVNNAGVTRFIDAADLEAVDDEAWSNIMDVNVKGAFQCVRAAKQAMLDSGGGHVINITSVAAFRGKGSSIPYCASKAALNNLTVALAHTLAPDIRVNAVAPGYIDSRWIRNAVGEDKYGPFMEEAAASVPLNKVSSPQDIADAIVGLLIGSATVTGQILVVDGGMLIDN